MNIYGMMLREVRRLLPSERAWALILLIKQAERADEKVRYFDALTKLPNESMLQLRIKEEISWANRRNKPFSFWFFDVVGLKHVNDTYGRFEGDKLIKLGAKALSETKRETDFLMRYGKSADEFSLLMRECDIKAARAFYERLKNNIDKYPFLVKDKELEWMFAGGFSLYSKGKDILEVILEAEESMQRDKVRIKEIYRLGR